MTAQPRQHRVCGGIFTPDPTLPPDPVSGLRVCICGLLGEAGDTHHTVPEPVEDARGLAAGERSEE